MTHVRARLSALVDGELDHDSRERILAHLTHCEECRVAADEERRIKALLSGLPGPAPSDDLNAFLVGLSAGGSPAELTDMASAPAGRASHATEAAAYGRRGLSPRIPLAVGGVGFARRRPPSRAATLRPRSLLAARAQTGPAGQRSRALPNLQGPVRRTSGSLGARPGGRLPGPSAGSFGRRAVVGVAGLAAMAGMAVVAAFAAGGSQSGAQVNVVPPVQQYSVEHANTVSDLPLSDPGAVTAVLERGRGERTTGR